MQRGETSGAAGRDLLDIPRRSWFGKWIGRQAQRGAAWADKWQRVQRHRYLERIKSSQRDELVREVQTHPAGREVQAALTAWCARSSQAFVNPQVPPREAASLRCTVIINTVDRARELARTLRDLKPLWNEADELIVVVGPTEDDTEAVIRDSGIACTVLHCAERNLAISRNLGWAIARGRYVAFIDDDASPGAGWLDHLLAPFDTDPQVAVVAGFVLDGSGRQFLNRYVVADTLGRAHRCEDAGAAQMKIEATGAQRAFLTATGCNMAFRRDALDAVGGFDPAYIYFLDETDVVRRIVMQGGKCVAAPESTVLHRLGDNFARRPTPHFDERIVLVRALLHFIGKFGKDSFDPAEIESVVWERILRDLEKIAWDEADSGPYCGDLQARYLAAATGELASRDAAPGGAGARD